MSKSGYFCICLLLPSSAYDYLLHHLPVTVLIAVISLLVSVCVMCLEGAVLQSLYSNSQTLPQAWGVEFNTNLTRLEGFRASLTSMASVAFCPKALHTGTGIDSKPRQPGIL